MRNTKLWLVWLPGLLLVAGTLYLQLGKTNLPALRESEALIQLDWTRVTAQAPTIFGVEYGWVDQDRDLFLDRYRSLAPRVLRVQISQAAFEPQNDNSDPNFSQIQFNQSFPLDVEWGKTLNFEAMFMTLAAEFPDMHFHMNIWLAAGWNADQEDGYLGLGGTFPPRSIPEHQEFIRALAGWLVSTCGIPPDQLSFSFVNEPNLDSFFTGSQTDLAAMAAATRAALDQVSTEISLSGLDEVHGLSWTDTFYPQRPAGCCQFWTFHAYERGVDSLWEKLSQRINHLSGYGPVWVTEFADTNNGSPDAKMDFSTDQAALGFARLGARLWGSGVEGVIHFRLADTYLTQLNGWAGHGLFADWRGTKSGGQAYAIYPSYWVFANLFQRLGDGQVVEGTFPSGLEGVAVKPRGSYPALAVWVVNPGQTSVTADVEISGFPQQSARIEFVDVLAGVHPVKTIDAVGSPLTFSVSLAAESAAVLWVDALLPEDPGTPLNQVFLPLLLGKAP